MRSYQYTDKNLVLHYLMQILNDELLPSERKIIYLFCGMELEKPMEFREISGFLKIETPEMVERFYNDAVQKTHAAIPGSKLERLVAPYTPISRNH